MRTWVFGRPRFVTAARPPDLARRPHSGPQIDKRVDGADPNWRDALKAAIRFRFVYARCVALGRHVRIATNRRGAIWAGRAAPGRACVGLLEESGNGTTLSAPRRN